MRFVWLFGILAVTWIFWSGHFKPLILTFGAISCVLVAWLDMRLDQKAELAQEPGFGFRWISYTFWLLGQIVVANLDVTKIILNPEMPMRPRLLLVKTTQQSEVGKVIYANSITLTPGTVTLDVRDDQLLVHALTEASAAGVLSGDMDARVTAMEGQRPATSEEEVKA